MITIVLPPIGHVFTFRSQPRWQFWRRTAGVGRIIAFDESIGVVHVAVTGNDDSEIRHIPILASQLARCVLQSHGSGGFEPQAAWPQIDGWRAENAKGEAGAFSVPLGDAIRLIEETISEPYARLIIETAYPTRSASGKFETVRAVVST